MLTPVVMGAFAFWFLLGGLLEIAGGYLIWQWLRESHPWTHGLAGAVLLAGFGVAMTFLPTHFGRAYASYGGVFIVLSLLWGWRVDGHPPDLIDAAGAGIILLGVAVMVAVPRP